MNNSFKIAQKQNHLVNQTFLQTIQRRSADSKLFGINSRKLNCCLYPNTINQDQYYKQQVSNKLTFIKTLIIKILKNQKDDSNYKQNNQVLYNIIMNFDKEFRNYFFDQKVRFPIHLLNMELRRLQNKINISKINKGSHVDNNHNRSDSYLFYEEYVRNLRKLCRQRVMSSMSSVSLSAMNSPRNCMIERVKQKLKMESIESNFDLRNRSSMSKQNIVSNNKNILWSKSSIKHLNENSNRQSLVKPFNPNIENKPKNSKNNNNDNKYEGINENRNKNKQNYLRESKKIQDNDSICNNRSGRQDSQGSKSSQKERVNDLSIQISDRSQKENTIERRKRGKRRSLICIDQTQIDELMTPQLMNSSRNMQKNQKPSHLQGLKMNRVSSKLIVRQKKSMMFQEDQKNRKSIFNFQDMQNQANSNNQADSQDKQKYFKDQIQIQIMRYRNKGKNTDSVDQFNRTNLISCRLKYNKTFMSFIARVQEYYLKLKEVKKQQKAVKKQYQMTFLQKRRQSKLKSDMNLDIMNLIKSNSYNKDSQKIQKPKIEFNQKNLNNEMRNQICYKQHLKNKINSVIVAIRKRSLDCVSQKKPEMGVQQKDYRYFLKKLIQEQQQEYQQQKEIQYQYQNQYQCQHQDQYWYQNYMKTKLLQLPQLQSVREDHEIKNQFITPQSYTLNSQADRVRSRVDSKQNAKFVQEKLNTKFLTDRVYVTSQQKNMIQQFLSKKNQQVQSSRNLFNPKRKIYFDKS